MQLIQAWPAPLLSGLTALAALTVLAACGADPGQTAPQNLLLVSVDTLRADALGCYGSERGSSPRIDELASEATRFEWAWSHSCKTAPSHMTMFTGLAPRVHGVDNLDTDFAGPLSPQAPLLAEILRDAGFRTAGITAGGNLKSELGFDRGFESYDDQRGKLPGKLADARAWISGTEQRSGAGARWFLFFHTYRVHDPYLPPEDLAGRYLDPGYGGAIVHDAGKLLAIQAKTAAAPPAPGDAHGLADAFWRRVDLAQAADVARLRDLYAACVADLDRELGDFLDWLRQRGTLERTLVVVTSDHGEEFGEHQMFRHEQLGVEVLRVPLIVRLPGGADASGGRGSGGLGRGQVIAAPVRHVDLAPSLLELLGVADAAPLRLGASWAAWLGGGPPVEARPAFAEHRAKRGGPLDLWALADLGFALHHARQGELLYDMGSDPRQERPLDDGPRAAALRERAAGEQAALQGLAGRFAPGAGAQLDPAELDPETAQELRDLGYL